MQKKPENSLKKSAADLFEQIHINKGWFEMTKQNKLIQQSIIRDMSEGVMVIGLRGTIQYVNPAALDILEKSEEQLASKKIGEIFINDSQNDPFSQTILDAIYDSSSVHYNLVSFNSKSGEKTVYVTTSFLHRNSKKIALIVMMNDMTDFAAMRKRYMEQMTSLMDSLVRALSEAIDERSPYTARHTRNMVRLGKSFLKWLDETDDPWRFDKKKKHAFLMSVWLHDVGKLSVPLEIMDKATRLDTKITDIEKRFARIHLLDKIALLEKRIDISEWEKREHDRNDVLSFIKKIDKAGWLSDEDIQKVNELSQLCYEEENLSKMPVLNEEELKCLLIRKGTLTDEERIVMQSHAEATKNILQKVNFPYDFSMVTEWAASHHELLNGKGYPQHKTDIPKEVCLLTILDIFEALTAKDRPYKKPMSAEKALDILHSMADEGSIDKNILDLFEKSDAWKVIL